MFVSAAFSANDTDLNKWVHHGRIYFYYEKVDCPAENQPSGPDDRDGKKKDGKKGGKKGDAKRK